MEDCLFCRIIQKAIPADTVYEDDEVLAFRDINPQAPTHILVIPKAHVRSVAEISDPLLLGMVMSRATGVAQAQGLKENGYRLVINHGQDGGQTVHHLHVHVLGGRPLHWPPG